ncbi:MAG TPA: hypothetical protein VMT86_10315 [Bryobacteraceae bacterium]|nr:hypothetical protein [Bryobacteraceae bacterium]
MGAQFGEVMTGEAGKNAAAPRSDLDGDAPAIGGMRYAAGEALVLETVDEFDGCIVIQKQALREATDRWTGAGAATGNHHEQLVLLGREAGFPGGAAAEIEKAADLIAEFGEGLQRAACRHHVTCRRP